MMIPFSTIKLFASEFEKRLSPYSVNKYTYGDRITVYMINDSLAILVEIVGYICSLCLNPEEMYGHYRNYKYVEFPVDGKEYCILRIEELTPNNIGFKYNNTKFSTEMKVLTGLPYVSCISYSKYTSQREEFWRCHNPEIDPNATRRIGLLFPELNLEERCANWAGEVYNYLILELEDIKGKIHIAVTYTKTAPHSYLIQLCKQWIETGCLNGIASIMGSDTIEAEMNEAFNSWKGIRRQKRLEEHLHYFSVQKIFADKVDAFMYLYTVLKKAKNGEFLNEERSTYMKPLNKWVSEELVYKLTKKIFGKRYAVIYQHRPYFLKSTKNGQMSYDVFISGADVAIEYQGKQHFEPVDFFGGEESFRELQLRDAEKLRLSSEHGIRLVYINYWEEITTKLITERVALDVSTSDN